MSLLARAGLYLGDVIPPAPDNPRGFFENRKVLEINNTLLANCGRDWTCPPPNLDHRQINLEPLETVIDQLNAESGGAPWGFKDPRTLFTLPAWAAAAGSCRLVGVHRNTHDIARSLAARNGFSLEEATAIAQTYAERLASAHRRLGFPIVSFDASPDEFLDRVESIATHVGLKWDSETLSSVFEAELIHHRTTSKNLGPIDDYLSEAAQAPIDGLRTFTAATIVRTWERIPSPLAEGLPLDLGPQYEEQVSELLKRMRQLVVSTSTVAVVERPKENPKPEHSYVVLNTTQFLKDNGGPSPAQRFSHVVGPTVLDDISPAQLDRFFGTLSSILEPRAVIGLGGWILTSEKIPSAQVIEPAGVKASRRSRPFLHHIDWLSAALLPHNLWIHSLAEAAGGRKIVYLTNDPGLRSGPLMPHELREAIASLEASKSELEQQVAHLRLEGIRLQENIQTLTKSLEDSADQVSSLQRDLQDLRSRHDATVRELRTAATRARQAHAKTQRSYERLQKSYTRLANRRAVKVALRAAGLFRPVFRLVRRIRRRRSTSPDTAPNQKTRRPTRTRQQIVDAIRSKTPQQPQGKPLVSIVVLTRNGAEHLSRLLPALSNTAYREFELIVIDNGSTDGTPELLKRPWPYPVNVLRNEFNQSFSEGNNRGANHARGELLLFLNDDIEPIGPDWLGAMVATLQQSNAVAVGAVLVYPERGASTDFTVQHLGIRLTLRDGAPHAENITAEDPLDPNLRSFWEVDAATAAALLVERDTFHQVGGFDPGYIYGTEDVDLCLRLRQHGRIVVAGEAVLFHHESASQTKQRREILRINRVGNWQRFAEKWGPTLTRSLLRRHLNPLKGPTSETSRTVAITLTRDDPEAGWGDYYTAHELGDAFAAEGWNVVYSERYRDHWYEIGSADLVISLLDSFDARKAPPGAYKIAWVRNWVDRWIDRPWFNAFDLVVTSSEAAASEIARRTHYRPLVVPLATNPRRFSPGPPVPTFEADIAFTGNNWGQGREVVSLLSTHFNERLLLFGKGWDSEPRVARYWRGHLPYELLPDLYRSVKVVLDDTAGPTRTHGFLNARVFDALAAGALVITDNVDASNELFDGMLPTYSNKHELRTQLDRYLNDERLRSETVAALRSRVLDRYTYDRLPSVFCSLATDDLDRPKIALKIGVPDESEMEAWGDTHFARAMAQALTDTGFKARIDILPDWDRPDRQDTDIVIHLRGLTSYTPKPAHLNVLWIISHPDDLVPGECDKYDLVVVASSAFAEKLASKLNVPVVFLPQASREVPDAPLTPNPELASEVLFVGNSRGQRRPVVDWAIEAGLPLTVYGAGWRGLIPDRYIRAEYFPNEQLPELYASAKVVLNDHWPDMREHGFVSNRVFDVLAAGGVLVSDYVSGMHELFGNIVQTYATPDEFEKVVTDLLTNDETREAIRRKGPEAIKDAHTFYNRAITLTELIQPLLKGRPKDIDGDVF